jgi:hypothetical protein
LDLESLIETALDMLIGKMHQKSLLSGFFIEHLRFS